MRQAIERRDSVQSEGAKIEEATEQSAPADLDVQTTYEAFMKTLKDCASVLAAAVHQIWDEGFDAQVLGAVADTLFVVLLEQSKTTFSLALGGDLSKASLKVKVAPS